MTREVEIGIEKGKKNLWKIMSFFSIALLLVFTFFLIIGLSVLVPDLISDTTSSNSSHLGGFGSYMNVIIAITSSITVGLVFYGVRIQSLEFQAMNDKLQQQINSQKNEEKINRTFKLIDEYTKNKDIIRKRSSREEIADKVLDTILKITLPYGEEIKLAVDIEMLSRFIKDYQVMDDIKYAIFLLDTEIELNEGFLARDKSTLSNDKNFREKSIQILNENEKSRPSPKEITEEAISHNIEFRKKYMKRKIEEQEHRKKYLIDLKLKLQKNVDFIERNIT